MSENMTDEGEITEMATLVRRLREPPFGTETSERNLMNAAADRIEVLEATLRKIYGMAVVRIKPHGDTLFDIEAAARAALTKE